jgi:putative drug exporter of the RND superfamily
VSNHLYRLGRLTVRRRRWVLVAWLVAMVALNVVGSRLGGETVNDFSVPGTESQAGRDVLEEALPREGARSQAVFQAPEGIAITDPALRAGIEAFFADVAEQSMVTDVGPVIPSPTEPRIGFSFITFDGDPGEVGSAAGKRLEDAAGPLRAAGIQVEFGGDLRFGEEELGSTAEIVGLGVAIIVLLVAFGSVVAMGLPLATALIGLGTGLGLITIAERFVSIPVVAPTLATMIGLGVGIDYALFIVTRHREHLHRGMTVEESAGRAIATAGQAVLFAGVTVVIAISGLQFVGIGSVAMMGYAIAVTVTVAVVAALTLLPALLGMAGHKIDKLRLPGVKVAAAGDENAPAARWSRHVARHPWPYLLGSIVLLVALLLPFFSIRLGSPDAGNDPPAATSRKAYDLLAEGFGPGFNGPLAVVVERGDAAMESALAAVGEALAADPEVAFVAPEPLVSDDGQVALLTVFGRSAPQAAATQDLVHRLRSDVLPATVAEAGLEQVLVTGSTAFFIDISDKITSRLPVFIGVVITLSFLLLMMVFRSVLVPLKAAIMNLLGIGAAYGVVVAVFQWQWGAGLIGVEEALPIISFLPMFMFAILFGLSMDYEVFLLSRIREEYLHSGNNTASVATGISHTARVITAAAIIMVSVFGSFAFNGDPTVKMFGIGLAVAIFLDATVIRMVLVPATMQLLGDRNWWLPPGSTGCCPTSTSRARAPAAPAPSTSPAAGFPGVRSSCGGIGGAFRMATTARLIVLLGLPGQRPVGHQRRWFGFSAPGGVRARGRCRGGERGQRARLRGSHRWHRQVLGVQLLWRGRRRDHHHAHDPAVRQDGHDRFELGPLWGPAGRLW